jgi:hypothetical protein
MTVPVGLHDRPCQDCAAGNRHSVPEEVNAHCRCRSPERRSATKVRASPPVAERVGDHQRPARWDWQLPEAWPWQPESTYAVYLFAPTSPSGVEVSAMGRIYRTHQTTGRCRPSRRIRPDNATRDVRFPPEPAVPPSIAITCCDDLGAELPPLQGGGFTRLEASFSQFGNRPPKRKATQRNQSARRQARRRFARCTASLERQEPLGE